MLALALAIAPGLGIMWYIYNKDRYDREPKLYLIISFLLGLLSVVPAILIESLGKNIFGETTGNSSIGYYAFFAFIIVACTEELSKYAMVRLYAYPKPAFNEPFDGIVYSVMVAMGFATLENIGYVAEHGLGTAFMRMFLSVPAHAAFGVCMGYYIGQAKFKGLASGFYIFKGLLLAIFFHGSFDFFLFLQESNIVKPYVSNGLLFLGAIVSFYFAVRFSLRAIKMHEQTSKIAYENRKN